MHNSCDLRTLQPVLEGFPKNNKLTKLSERCYAICGFGVKHVSATLLPLQELLCRRTALVQFHGQSWQLLERREDVSWMEGTEATLPEPDQVEFILMLALRMIIGFFLMNLIYIMNEISELKLKVSVVNLMSPTNL